VRLEGSTSPLRAPVVVVENLSASRRRARSNSPISRRSARRKNGRTKAEPPVLAVNEKATADVAPFTRRAKRRGEGWETGTVAAAEDDVLADDAGGGRTERRQVLLPGPCCYPVTVHRAEFATRVFGRDCVE